jgi:chloramphenicol-sensitive protein RarD
VSAGGMSRRSRGTLASLLASVLFASMYYLSGLLAPLSGEEVFGWRVIVTVPCITAFILATGSWDLVRVIAGRVRRRPVLALALVASSALVGVQLWLFMWAPLHGMALDVSLGYFLLPLVMIVTGRVIYKERLTALQIAAAAVALVGVTNELIRVGGVSWATLLAALGYPVYFVLRRSLGTAHLGGFWFDMVIALPVAIGLVVTGPTTLATADAHPQVWIFMPLAGLIGAAALILYMIASRSLSLGVFGLFSYVEPVLLVCAALVLGEKIKPAEWLTYIPIWIAVALLALEGTRLLIVKPARPPVLP